MNLLSGVDSVAISSHKFYGPKGIGAVLCNPKSIRRLKPMVFGGGQQNGLRSGTLSAPLILGMSAALTFVQSAVSENAPKMCIIKDRFEELVKASIDELVIHGVSAPRLSNTSYISFAHIEGEALQFGLADAGIIVSTGSACASQKLDPSHVLQAMRVPREFINGSARFSFSNDTSLSDIEYSVEVLRNEVARLRQLSPFYNVPNEKR
jgi:cysteine desulfurase